MVFEKATKKQIKGKFTFIGPSGSGKTLSALKFARGLVGKDGNIAVLDSEQGSSTYYSEMIGFDVKVLNPPFTPERYVDGIRDAVEAGYDALIVDSLSHAWAGEGGVLELHSRATEADVKKNSYTAWGKVTPRHNSLVGAIIHAPIHIICCMRTKTAYEVDTSGGKMKPQKIGLTPIQRDGFEYEFDIAFDLDQESHLATVSKDRTGSFDTEPFLMTERFGTDVAVWFESGEIVEEEPETPTPPETKAVAKEQKSSTKESSDDSNVTQKIIDVMQGKKNTLSQDQRSTAWKWITALDDGCKELLLKLLNKSEKIDSKRWKYIMEKLS